MEPGFQNTFSLVCYAQARNQMQTRENAENVVFNVPEFSSQVIRDTRCRDRKQKSKKPIKSQNQKPDVQRYQGAGRNRRHGTHIKSHKQKADGQTNPEGQAKIENQTKGVFSNISRIWRTRSSAQKNDQRSDSLYVQRLQNIYTGESNKLCGSWGGTKQSTREETHGE